MLFDWIRIGSPARSARQAEYPPPVYQVTNSAACGACNALTLASTATWTTAGRPVANARSTAGADRGAGCASSEQRLGRFLRAYLESTLQDRRRGRVVSIESSALDPAMDAHRNQTLQRFVTVAVEALPAETRRSLGNARLWSVMLGGAVNEVVVDCIVSPGEVDLETLANDLTEIWTRTLQP